MWLAGAQCTIVGFLAARNFLVVHLVVSTMELLVSKATITKLVTNCRVASKPNLWQAVSLFVPPYITTSGS